MGMFDFVGDALGGLADMGGSLLSSAKDYLAPALDMGASLFTGGLIPPGTVSSALEFLGLNEGGFTRGLLGDLGGSILGGLGGALADFPGAAAGKYMDEKSATTAWERSKEAATTAYDRSVAQYRSRYQDTMSDMRKAGLNPILAASGGFNVGNAPQMQPAQAFMAAPSKMVGSAASALEVSKTAQAQEETKRTVEESRKIRQEVVESVSRIDKNIAEKELFNQQEEKVWKEVKLLAIEMTRVAADIELKKQDIRVGMAEESKLIQEKKVLVQTAEEISVRLKRLRAVNANFEGEGGKLLGLVAAILESANINTGVVLTPGLQRRR